MGDTGRNKEIVRAWLRGWNEQGVGAIDEVFHPDFFDQQLAARSGGDGSLAALKASLAAYASVLADGRFEEQDLIAEADRVMVRWVLSGRHVGDFLGIAATGRSFAVDGANIFRVGDDKIIERWSFFDAQSLMGQLRGPE